MSTLARTARTMPGVQDKFRMPAGQSVQEVLTTARAFAAEAETLKDEFVRRGKPADFLEDFNARIEKVKQSLDGRAQKSAARISSRVAVAGAAQSARDAVREFDPIVRNVFADDPAALAE